MKKFFLHFGLVILFTYMMIGGCSETEQVFGCDCEQGYNFIEHKTLSKNNPSTTISVYNNTYGDIADASCHCLMTLTFRWSDDERAKTDERPPISYTFQAAGGNFYFPSDPANEIIETNSDGTKQWTLTINEAQDKNLHEGTSYGIHISYNSSYSPEGSVVCSGEFTFMVFSEDAYKTGCERLNQANSCNPA